MKKERAVTVCLTEARRIADEKNISLGLALDEVRRTKPELFRRAVDPAPRREPTASDS